MTYNENIYKEKNAFDTQINERINNGHVPDLQNSVRNEWFYNNVWRDPEYLRMSFIENINELAKPLTKKSKILEVGCGPGHTSLELARLGHDVTGIDLSTKCIEIANNTYINNKNNVKGNLNYIATDFIEHQVTDKNFDAVLFYCSLSHFVDINLVISKVSDFLNKNGLLLIYDTCVEQYNEKDAIIIQTILSLLSLNNNYYKSMPITDSNITFLNKSKEFLSELKYEDHNGENLQSPNDNSQTLNSMIESINQKFEKILFNWDCSFYRNIIGGLRANSIDNEYKIAKFIKKIDKCMIETGILNPAYFYYVGKKR